jgi:serine/threonine protein kinase
MSDVADDLELGKLLLERGLLAQDEFDEAEAARKVSGQPLAEILVQKSFLSPVQLKDAIAALQKRVRFCPKCSSPVFVTRTMPDGEKCPRCLGPVVFQEETIVARNQDLDSIVQLTKDELPPDVQQARSLPGRLFGKYVLLKEVGRGGAGIVQKAWDMMLGEHVALKFIREQKHAADSGSARKIRQEQILDLLQEARAALRLRHDHIVAVRDIGRIDQQFYIAMEYIEGETLADHVRSSQARGRLSPLYENPAFYLGCLRDVANAIHYAHTVPKPIVHCDLKPGNILIARSGNAYVMDFGLARALLEGQREAEEEKIRGTPAYMAPEQLTGKSDDIGAWTDVYAMGATLYELLAGRAVFTGEPLEILLKAMRDAPEKPSEVIRKSPEGKREESTKIMLKMTKLEAVCLRCLAKDPKNRYGSARQVAEELETVLEAMEMGRETGMVPDRIREAQVRAELHRVEEHMTRFDLEAALKEAEKVQEKRDGSRIRHRLAERRNQVLFLEQFRTRLIQRLNAQRPGFVKFELVHEALEGVEILKATVKKIYLLVGDRPREVEWAQLRPIQVVSMAEAMTMTDPDDRLALGILCHHARLIEQAVRYLTSLAGTAHDDAAQHILHSTG